MTQEKKIPLGSVGEVDIKIEQGIATVSVGVKVLTDEQGVAGAEAGAFAKVSTDILLDKIFAAIEAKSGPGIIPIEEGVKNILKMSAKSI